MEMNTGGAVLNQEGDLSFPLPASAPADAHHVIVRSVEYGEEVSDRTNREQWKRVGGVSEIWLPGGVESERVGRPNRSSSLQGNLSRNSNAEGESMSATKGEAALNLAEDSSDAAIVCRRRYTKGIMATTAGTVYSHITKNPKVRAGKACIEGTRVAVEDIVFYFHRGYSAARIQEEFPQLNLAQVYAALSYYHDQKDEIDASIKANEGTTERLERQWQDYVDRHGGHPPEEPVPEDRHIARPVDWPPKA